MCHRVADMLNDGYQSMEVRRGGRGPGKRRKRPKEKRRRARRKVKEIERKRMSHGKKNLRGPSGKFS